MKTNFKKHIDELKKLTITQDIEFCTAFTYFFVAATDGSYTNFFRITAFMDENKTAKKDSMSPPIFNKTYN